MVVLCGRKSMCDWIDKEIEHIIADDVVAPDYSWGEYETLLPGAIVCMRLRKMYTRVRQLYAKMQAILDENGLHDEDTVIDIPYAVILQLRPIMSRALALESAIRENLMSEYDLWQHVTVVISKTWEVFYRTYEQEVLHEQYLARQSYFGEQRARDDNFDYPLGSFDPKMN